MHITKYIDESIIVIIVISIAYYAWKNYKEERRIKKSRESEDK